MKKITFLFAFIVLAGISNATTTLRTEVTINSDYTVNDQQVDALFASSVDVTNQLTVQSNVIAASLFDSNSQNSFKQAGGDKNALTAIILDFFLGGLGIHRAYLGTKTMTWVGYILSCGGIGGLVPFVDLVVLAVNYHDISKFEGNPKFFMW